MGRLRGAGGALSSDDVDDISEGETQMEVHSTERGG